MRSLGLKGEMDLVLLLQQTEAVSLDVIVRRLQYGRQRNQPDDLRACHGQIQRGGVLLGLFVGHVYGRDLVVREVDGDLCEVLLLKEPPDGLAAGEAPGLAGAAALAAQVQCDPVRLF